MRYKWIGSLMLCIFFLGASIHPAQAALSKGKFVPTCRVQSIVTDSKIKYYQVRQGDTLWDISRTYNIDMETVLAVNDLGKNSVLSVGQTLKIPYSRSRIHIIRGGETMWEIANRYDVSVEQLQRMNQGKSPPNLTIGDKLIIPDSTLAMAITTSSRGISLGGGMFTWPVIGAITSYYGWRKSGFHHGLDIAAKLGDPIKACASGKVIFAGDKPVYGKMVIIEHPDGKQTIYAHAQKILVNQGQSVKRGQVIATVGTTGRTTGPHLHLEVKIGDKNYNPLNFLRS
ncbi:peptidoglycan DD-metalloendopeptidase family protein [Syntrophomonas erecta]